MREANQFALLGRYSFQALVFCVVLSASHVFAQTSAKVRQSKAGLSVADLQFIDELFADFSGERPGASVMIAKGDELVFCKAYGLADVVQKTPVTCETNFAIGSVCKQFTAMAILKLIDRGELELETTLSEVFPDFPEYGKKISVFQLLTHQSGLPGYGPLANFDAPDQLSDHDVLEYLKSLEKWSFEPGTRFEYSNSAFAVLAEIVEKRSGVPFQDYMRDEIFSPIGMVSTEYNVPGCSIPRRAVGNQVGMDTVVPKSETRTSAIKGDGSIYTSAKDYFRWHLALNNNLLVSSELLNQSCSPQKGTDGKYGFGWFMSDDDSENYVHHGGATSSGYITYAARIPQSKITVAIFTNREWNRDNLESQNLPSRARALLSIASDGQFPMPAKTALDDQARWIQATIQNRMAENDIPAVSIGIIRDGKTKLVEGFGSLDRNDNTTVTADTVFQIASVSKVFTGLIVNGLVEAGKLDLNESITTYLAESIDNAATERLRHVKLKHLMQHTSGVPHRACSIAERTNDPAHSHWENGYSEKDLIVDLNKLEQDFEPGSEFAYSSSGYTIVGYICEVVSGESFEQLLRSHVTEEFGMNNTTGILDEALSARIAVPYDPANRSVAGRVVDWGKAVPPSGLFSTANDLVTLMNYHIKAYRLFHDTAERGLLVQTDHPDTDNSTRTNGETKTHYGLGLFKWLTKNKVVYGHGGDNDGFAIYYEFEPEAGNGLVMMSSSGGRWFTELGKEINARLRNQRYVPTPSRKSLAQAVFDITMQQGVSAAIKHFEGHRDSGNYYFREDEMNNAGYALLQAGRTKDSIEIFSLNVNSFPDSWNAYDSLGEAYAIAGDKELAVLNYEKSIQLNPNNVEGKEKLRKLRNQ